MSNDDATMGTTTVEIPAYDLARAREPVSISRRSSCAALSERLFAEALDSEMDGYVAAFADWAPDDDWSDRSGRRCVRRERRWSDLSTRRR